MESVMIGLRHIPWNAAGRIARHLPLNTSTEIRVTRLCTQNCRQCGIHSRTGTPPVMGLEEFRTICARLREYGAYIGFISGGEALLVPHLDQILLEAKKTFRIATTLVTGLYHATPVVERIGALALENGIHIQTSLDGLGSLGDDLRGVRGFSDTVLKHMGVLSRLAGGSPSLLYANIVLNHLNLDEVPELIRCARDLGWKTTIGLYHTLTGTTRFDEELKLRADPRLDRLIRFLEGNPDILNLPSFIRGIPAFVKGKAPRLCAFTDAPFFATRTTVMENGAVHLCFGEPIGNLLSGGLESLFRSAAYRERLEAYRACGGCWTTCYTQRYLLVRPHSMRELAENMRRVAGLGRKRHLIPDRLEPFLRPGA